MNREVASEAGRDQGSGKKNEAEVGQSNGQEHPQNRQEDTPENRRQRQTLPLRHVPQEKLEARENFGSLVLPQLPEPESPANDFRMRLVLLRGRILSVLLFGQILLQCFERNWSDSQISAANPHSAPFGVQPFVVIAENDVSIVF